MILCSQRGQLMVPFLGIFLCMVFALLVLIHEGRQHLHRMRLELAADAVALSQARAQAGMLSTISVLNGAENAYFVKEDIPGLADGAAIMYIRQLKPFMEWNKLLVNAATFYSAFPNGVANSVARANHVRLKVPISRGSQLKPRGLNTAVVIHPWPPLFFYKHFEKAYYTRKWSPGKRKAQPTHAVLCSVSDAHGSASAMARVWLDVGSQSIAHNGGFPRYEEDAIGGIGIQSFHPQFTARLLPRPNWAAIARFLASLR